MWHIQQWWFRLLYPLYKHKICILFSNNFYGSLRGRKNEKLRKFSPLKASFLLKVDLLPRFICVSQGRQVRFHGSKCEHHIPWSSFSSSKIQFLIFTGRPRNCLRLLLNFCKVESSEWLYHSPLSFLLSDKRKSRLRWVSFRSIFSRTSHSGRWVGQEKMLSVSEKESRCFNQDSPVCVHALLPGNDS